MLSVSKAHPTYKEYIEVEKAEEREWEVCLPCTDKTR